MRRVIEELNEVCLKHAVFPYSLKPMLTSVWWSSFTLKNTRRQMEDYIAVVPYLHTLFDIKVSMYNFIMYILNYTLINLSNDRHHSNIIHNCNSLYS